MAAAYGIYAAQGGTARVVGTTIESRAGRSGDDRLTTGIKMVAVTGGRVTNAPSRRVTSASSSHAPPDRGRSQRRDIA